MSFLRRAADQRRNAVILLVVIVAAVALVGDLITLVYYFLDGDVSLRFLLKVLVVGALAGLPGTLCAATGVFNAATSAPDLMDTVGPCRATDGTSVF